MTRRERLLKQEADLEAALRAVRLIAAAPDLLEALQGLANALEATPGPRGVMELVPSQLENARAVIRKANGAAS